MRTFKELTEKIRKGSEKDYIVIMTNRAGKEFKRIDYKTEKEAPLLNLSLQNLLDNLLTNPHIHTQFYFDNIYKN